jgi:hypothetical protein
MTTVATLDTQLLVLPPGGEASCELLIQNRGDIVEGYRIEVLGEAAPWATVEPPTLSVYPGTQAGARVVFRIPRGYDVPAADIPFGVRVLPVEHPEHAVVPEAIVRVGAYAETTAELVPRTSRTRRVATHDVAVDNRGNAPLRVDLAAGDPDNALKLKVRPAALVVPPGQTAIAQVTARHRKVHWRGQPAARPFQVEVAGEQSAPLVLDGSSIQEPVFAMWLPKLLALLAALAILLAGVWFGLLKPAVKSAAEKAAQGQVNSAMPKLKDANSANGAGGNGNGGGGGPTPSSTTGNVGANGNGGPTPAPSGPPSGAPFSGRLDVEVANGQTKTSTLTVPAGKTFRLTDAVIGNPQGDTGEVDVIAGDQNLVTMSSANFRVTDYHWVTGIVVPAGKQVKLTLTCTTAGPPLPKAQPGRCRHYVSFTGVLQSVSP